MRCELFGVQSGRLIILNRDRFAWRLVSHKSLHYFSTASENPS